MNVKIRRALAGLGVTAIASAMAAPAMAASADRWDWNYTGFYIGGGVNATQIDTTGDFSRALADDLSDLNITTSGDFSDMPIGGQLYAGWMLNRYFGIEGRWSDSADAQDGINVSDGLNTQRLDLEASIDGWTVYGVANWPFAQRWDLFGKLGYTTQDIKVSAKIDGAEGGTGSASDDDDGFAAAVGLRWRFAHHWAATVEAEYLDVNFQDTIDEPYRGSLNIEYWFGGHEIPVAAPVAAAAVVAAPPPPPARPVDSDGDGVVDGSDQCPETPKGDRVGPAGCSCDVTRQVQFKLNSAELTDEDKVLLDEMAVNLTKLKFISGTVIGHTDSSGSDAYNQKLSERRAESVSAYLQSKGVAVGRLNASGAGESQPIADNKTAEGRALNRRVVLQRTDCDAPK